MTTKDGGRFPALDVLRGAAVAGMILVNNPGDWSFVFAPIRHAEWNGWTLADMVFPTFLFSVGVAVGLSFPKRLPADAAPTFWKRVGRRVLLLILLGLALEAGHTILQMLSGDGAGWAHIRLPGVLQRIGLCYGLAILVAVFTARRDEAGVLHLRPAAVAAIGVALLVGYWLAMTFAPVPGYGAGRLDPAGNLGAWLDRAIFTTRHLWSMGWATPNGPVVYDPEGLFSTLPALVNTLVGVLVGYRLKATPERACLFIAIGGAVMFVLGVALNPIFPINKALWTSSFALVSSGFSALIMAAFMVLLRVPAARTAAAPFFVLGSNAILAYIASSLYGLLSGVPFLPTGSGWTSMQGALNGAMLAVARDPYLASFLTALIICAVITALLWPLHRRAIHFRL